MLWGAAAAGIPIALHFFFRSRYRTVPWAAMKFLLASIEQTSRRLRFQELLLLMMRVALLALLALALARPITAVGGGAGRGEAVDAVLLIDTSYSMAAQDGSATRLERAKTAALSVIDQLPGHSTVQIVTCSDRALLAGPRSPSNLDQARGIVEELRVDHLATDLLPGIQESAAALQRGQASNKEFYLVSDMQKLGFEKQAGGVIQSLKDMKEKATIYLVRCGRSKSKNVAVVGIAPQSGIPRPGERAGFAVLIRNSGSEAVKDLRVSLMVDGDPKSQETQALDGLGPGETRAVTLTGKLEKAGLRVLTAKVENDDLDADNCFDQVVQVREQVNVLIVDGAPQPREPAKSASFFLEHALVPVKDEAERLKYYLQVQNVPPRLALPARLAKQDVCILVNVPVESAAKRAGEVVPAEFADELAKFVRAGHGLMIFAGDNVAPEAYNRVLGDKRQLLPLKIKDVKSYPAKEALVVNRESVALPAFEKFKEDERFKGLSYFGIFRTLELEQWPVDAETKDKETPGKDAEKEEKAKVVLRYNNGKPMVATRQVGTGEVMLFATSADPGWKAKDPNPTWNEWPLYPGFMYLPFMDMAVSYLLHGQTQNHNLIAGTTLRWYPQEKEPKAYTLIHPDGRAERLGLPVEVKGRQVVTATDLKRAGIYTLFSAEPKATAAGQTEVASGSPLNGEEAGKDKGMPLAVVPDLRESEDLESLTDEQIDERLAFRPIHVTAGESASTFSEVERLNREWTLWILLAVLVLAVSESLLAWWCGRGR